MNRMLLFVLILTFPTYMNSISFHESKEHLNMLSLDNYLDNVLRATNPQNAPNYNQLPDSYPDRPSRLNRTIIPVYTIDNP